MKSDDKYLYELWAVWSGGHSDETIAIASDMLEDGAGVAFVKELRALSDALEKDRSWYLAHDADAMARNIEVFLDKLKSNI